MIKDDQPLTRKEREILEFLKKKNDTVQKRKRKSKIKNNLLRETAKLGYTQLPWEDTDHLVKRIIKDNRSSIEGELLKAKFGISGRNEKEIAKDYKLLDEKEERNKAQKKNRLKNIEKLKANAEAKKMAKIKAKQLKKKTKLDVENINEIDSMDVDYKNQINSEHNSVENNLKKSFNYKAVETNYKNKNADLVKPKRLRKKDKLRLKKKQNQKFEKQEILLNAREIIPFGEIADAPPKFVGKFRDLINKSRSEAGKMDLMLKKLHPDLMKERQIVIDIYRRSKLKIDE